MAILFEYEIYFTTFAPTDTYLEHATSIKNRISTVKKLYLTLLVSIFYCGASAQTEQTDKLFNNYSGDIDYTKIQLPPLQVFLDAAHSYADVKYFESKKEEQEHQLKLTKKDWLSYLRLQGNYQYGTNNTYMSQMGEQLPPNYGYSTIKTQSWYNGGAVLSIPLNDIFSRKQKIGTMKARVEQADYELERAIENRQLIILETYNEVIKHLSILKVQAETMALYDAQMLVSENDFINGQIDIISLSLERGRRATAIVSYEESRAALNNSVTLLEMLTKVKIIQR